MPGAGFVHRICQLAEKVECWLKSNRTLVTEGSRRGTGGMGPDAQRRRRAWGDRQQATGDMLQAESY